MMLRKNLDTIAQEICHSDIRSTEPLLEQVDFVLASAKIPGRPDPILKMKRSLARYIGAAYYLRDAARFHAAVAAYQATTDDLLTSFDVPAEALLVDLCLAIICGPANLRQATIAAIMRDAREPDTPDALRAAARILAATCDLDAESAISDALALLGACRQQALPDEHGNEGDGRLQAVFWPANRSREHMIFAPVPGYGENWGEGRDLDESPGESTASQDRPRP